MPVGKQCFNKQNHRKRFEVKQKEIFPSPNDFFGHIQEMPQKPEGKNIVLDQICHELITILYAI